jgi:hypothetical protein
VHTWNGQGIASSQGTTRASSSSYCVAAESNEILTFNGATWSKPTAVDVLGHQINGISCPTSKFCAAVDDWGNALVLNGTTWSKPVSLGNVAANLSSISCPSSVSCSSSAFCLPDDENGDVYIWRST